MLELEGLGKMFLTEGTTFQAEGRNKKGYSMGRCLVELQGV